MNVYQVVRLGMKLRWFKQTQTKPNSSSVHLLFIMKKMFYLVLDYFVNLEGFCLYKD